MSMETITDPTSDRPLLTSISRGCALLGLSRSKLYRLLADDEIETVKVGTKRLIVMSSLEDFVARLRGCGDQ